MRYPVLQGAFPVDTQMESQARASEQQFFSLETGRITRFSVLHRGARSGAQGKSELCVQSTRPAHCSLNIFFCRPCSGAPDDFVFDGNAIFSVTCRDRGSFTSVSTCSEPTFSFVAAVRDAITASVLAEAFITCKTVSRSGTARTSSTGAAQVGWCVCWLHGSGTCRCVSGSVQS